jgi:hypothetical protein
MTRCERGGRVWRQRAWPYASCKPRAPHRVEDASLACRTRSRRTARRAATGHRRGEPLHRLLLCIETQAGAALSVCADAVVADELSMVCWHGTDRSNCKQDLRKVWGSNGLSRPHQSVKQAIDLQYETSVGMEPRSHLRPRGVALESEKV